MMFFERWTSGFCTHLAKYSKCKAQQAYNPSCKVSCMSHFSEANQPEHDAFYYLCSFAPGIFLQLCTSLKGEQNRSWSLQSVNTRFPWRSVASPHSATTAYLHWSHLQIWLHTNVHNSTTSLPLHWLYALQTKPCRRSTCFLQQQTCQNWQLYQGCCLQQLS